MSLPNRIDVHQHVVPPFYAKALPTHGDDPSGMVIPQWSPESAIADAFLIWDKDHQDGQLVVVPGLLERREIERAYYLNVPA
jgi:hypothetical protein